MAVSNSYLQEKIRSAQVTLESMNWRLDNAKTEYGSLYVEKETPAYDRYNEDLAQVQKQIDIMTYALKRA